MAQGVAWSSWDGYTRWSAPSESVKVTTEAKLADTPLFVRQGAVVSMWPPGRRLTPPANRTKVFSIWTAAIGSASCGNGTWYEDDGETLNYRTAAPASHAYSDVSWKQTTLGHVTINISSPSMEVSWLPHNYRTYAVQLRGVTSVVGNPRVCRSGDAKSGSTSTLMPCTQLLDIEKPDPEWAVAGWWSQGKAEAESSVPDGTVVVVLPPLGVGSVASLRIDLK